MSKLDHFKANRKKIAPVILLLVIVAGVWFFTSNRETHYTGIAEAVIMTNPAEISGKIIESNIALGQEVNAGDVIAVIDSSDLEYALEQLKLSLERAQILYTDAKTGQDSRAQSGVAAAQAAVNSAEAVASQTNQDYQKALDLHRGGAISESALDAAKLLADTAAGALDAAKAQLNLARNNSAGSVSESTNIDILLLESRIAQQEDMIEKCVVTAKAGGTVISRNYSSGDFVAPGYDIADIASMSERYIVVYYPKDSLSDISYDARYTFIYDNSEYTGTVKFIDVRPVYTPKDFQTQANKNKESVKIKLLVPENCPVKPGEAVKMNFL